MLARVFSSELLKLRRTWIYALVLLGPGGVIGLQGVNFGLRYDYLMNIYKEDLWGAVLLNISFLALPALLLGTTIVSSLLGSMEHREQSFKHLLALPVRRMTVFLSKLGVLQMLLLLACTILAFGSVLFGLLLGLEFSNLPWTQLLILSFVPWIAAWPIVSLQLSLSLLVKNQAASLTAGIIISVMSLYASAMPVWIPLTWPLLPEGLNGAAGSAAAGITAGAAVCAMGLIHFTRKDVD